MPTLGELVDLLHAWYPPGTAEDWDAVGLVSGDPLADVARVQLAVDPTIEVAREAAAWGADLLVVHHPLFLRGVHGVARDTAKGRTLGVLQDAGCALLTAHTNADRAEHGVAQALADALGVTGQRPLVPDPAPDGSAPRTGIGRVGELEVTLGELARRVAAVVPAAAQGVRVSGDLDRVLRTVAVSPGSGDEHFAAVLAAGADAYVTSDLRHHPVTEFVEKQGTAVVDVAHWAGEWPWLPVLRDRLVQAWGDRVEVRVSDLVTDAWSSRI